MNLMPFTLLGFGFLLGVKHAFDADHVAAVSTFAAKNKSIRESSLLGMFWGFGHTISLLLVGLIILLLKITIPRSVSLSLEFIVGVMLVVLGLNVLFTINKNKIHLHKHKHEQEEHIHFHSHKTTKRHYHEHLPFHQSLFVGLIHGLAGSAALSLLVLTAIKSVWAGMAYILVFGIGSIIGMMIISSIISLPFALIPQKLERTQRILRVSAGLISAITGLIIII
ncbi:sulfite exporter TauE/SafE family protein [Candidatus Woesearchaeota archaeon]|nr:sulfite exporter TauE/SafE family protein [Candidatus Woesearchaeota archaeon]